MPAAPQYDPRMKARPGVARHGLAPRFEDPDGEKKAEVIQIPRTVFTIQFVWRPIPKVQRTEQPPGEKGGEVQPAPDATPAAAKDEKTENKADENAQQSK